MVKSAEIIKDGKKIAKGEVLNVFGIQEKMDVARGSLDKELDKFAANTMSYLQQEKGFLLETQALPEVKVSIKNKPVLIVVRGYNYKKDLQILKSYIREKKPVLIGVDGGADALLEAGYKPDIIIGDMDSASDKALKSGAELVAHAYPNGESPALKRLTKMKLEAKIFKAAGTSEDIAMLLAYDLGAELIVLVGSHVNLIEFLDKGREGMASTFLVRLKVGERLVDAKGVSSLYQESAKLSHLLIMVLSAMMAIMVIIWVSPTVRNLISLLISRLQLTLGF